MVGKYIAQLESQLATRLLERNTDARASPTPGESMTKRNGDGAGSIAESAVERLRLAPAGTCG